MVTMKQAELLTLAVVSENPGQANRYFKLDACVFEVLRYLLGASKKK